MVNISSLLSACLQLLTAAGPHSSVSSAPPSTSPTVTAQSDQQQIHGRVPTTAALSEETVPEKRSIHFVQRLVQTPRFIPGAGGADQEEGE